MSNNNHQQHVIGILVFLLFVLLSNFVGCFSSDANWIHQQENIISGYAYYKLSKQKQIVLLGRPSLTDAILQQYADIEKTHYGKNNNKSSSGSSVDMKNDDVIPAEFSQLGQHYLPTFSFLIQYNKNNSNDGACSLLFHHNFVCALLNDLFGIQMRGNWGDVRISLIS